METKNIKDFLTLAELGNSYLAAEKLYMSQSTLVRHVQAFEEELGVALFDRSRQGFSLNEAGRIFLPYAQKIAQTQARCYRALHRDEEDTVIRVMAEGKIIDLIIDFKKAYPQYSIDYIHTDHAVSQLKEGILDVIFVANGGEEDEGLEYFYYYSEEVLLIVPESHPLAGRENVRLEELKDEKFVETYSEYIISDTFMNTHGQFGFAKQNISLTVPIPSDLIVAVQEGLGIALLHGKWENASPVPGVRAIRIEPKIEYDINICYRRERRTEAVEKFIQFAKKWRIMHKDADLTPLQHR